MIAFESILLLSAIAYCIGSIPFAYLALRLTRGTDIRFEGSGNVGAMNTFDVSGSKPLALTVGLLDALKGVVALFLCRYYFAPSSSQDLFLVNTLSTFFVTVGHVFPIWLKFKGGRGLATAGAATLFFAPSMPISWAVVWLMAWKYSPRIHFCNVSGTIGMLLIAPFFERIQMLYFILFMSGLLILSHRDVLRSSFRN